MAPLVVQSKADLTVLMEPTQLAAVIQFLRPGVQGCTDAPKRTYKRNDMLGVRQKADCNKYKHAGYLIH